MFSLTILSAASIAVSAVSGLVIPRYHPYHLNVRSTAPEGYAEGYLESYTTYHTRYLALDCENQHNTTFFEACCHPLLATESLSDREAQCTPSASASASASAAEPTSTVVADGDDGDDDCDDDDSDDEDSSSVTTSTATATHTSASSAATTSKDTDVVKTTSSSKAAVTTSTSKATTKTTSSKASTSTSSSSSGTETGGVATFFYQDGVAGACGTVHSDDDLIAAIDQDRYGDSGAVSSLCGKQVKITNTNNQKTVTVTIADDCPTCDNSNSIDLSVGAFTTIATEDEGEVPITWEYL